MNLDHLRTLVAVWRAGSISKASLSLNLTQPAASAHIRALETQIGKPLFRRHARGAAPTTIADELSRGIGDHLDAIEATFEQIRTRSSQTGGVVHFGGPAEFITARMPPIFAALLREGIEVRTQLGGRDHLYALFDGLEIEMGITASEPQSTALGYAPVFQERLILAASPAFATRHLDAGGVPLSRLPADLPWIAYDETLPLIRPYMTAVFGTLPGRNAAMVMPSLTLIRDVVASGAGVSVLPDYLCQTALETGALVEVAAHRPAPVNTLYLVWRRSEMRNPRVVHVRDHCLKALRPTPD